MKIKNLKNKKGAVATTMTWVVATISILVVMLLFLLASGGFGFSGFLGEKKISPLRFPEQKQSLFSIAGNQEITSLIKGENYDEAGKKIEIILKQLGKPEALGEWKFFIYKDKKEKKQINPFNIIGWYDSQNFYLNLKGDSEIKFKLSLECQDDICYDFLE